MSFGQRLKAVGSLLLDSARESGRLHVTTMSAALAFFGLFALPPLIVVLLLIGGEFIGEFEARESLLVGVEETYGKDARASVELILRGAPQLGTDLVFTQLISALVFIYAAFAGFGHVQGCFNRIWGVSGGGFRVWGTRILKRVVSFFLVVAIGLIALFATSAGVLVRTFPEEIGAHLPVDIGPVVVHVLEGVILVALNVLILTLIYKMIPDPFVPWRAAFAGATVAAVLLVASRYPFEYYIDHSWRSSLFGAASSLVALLVALYVSSFLVLYGCVASRVVARPLSVPEPAAEPSS